jgi:peptidoglycan hydrolase-like protein with peptidoglycan-binding domain
VPTISSVNYSEVVKGYRTAAMQKALNDHGADLNGDGEFGSKTLAALRAFQQKAGLSITGKGDAATLVNGRSGNACRPNADLWHPRHGRFRQSPHRAGHRL